MAKLTKRTFDFEDLDNQAVRINKFLSDAGVCSRREADAFVEQGKVLIDGVPAAMGSKVTREQIVTFCGKVVAREEKMVLIAMNKPQGIVCTTDRREPDNIIDFINYGKRIYPIGRLDKDSEGLILITNHGDIVNKILRAGNFHEKEYIVTVNKPLTAEFLKGMSKGVPILDTVTRPCTVEAVNKTTFRIILTQGLNRQIRRMCEYFDYKVMKLERIRIMNVTLGHLQSGGYRNLTERELETLRELIEDSQSIAGSYEEESEDLKAHVYLKNINSRVNHSIADKKRQYKGKNFSKDRDGATKKPVYVGKTAPTTGEKSNQGSFKESGKKSGDRTESHRESKFGRRLEGRMESKSGDRTENRLENKSGKRSESRMRDKSGSKAREDRKREYGNARQKTANHRANRASR